MQDRELLKTFASDVVREGLNVNYAQIWREGRMTAEYRRIPVKT